MKQSKEVIIDKLNLLPEERQNEVLDFINFLLAKDDCITLDNMRKSLDDIKKGNIRVVENANDLKDHFNQIKI
jgi:hypothetical protein